jgi:hypothetical protein
VSDPKAVTIWSKIEGIDDLAELALNLHWSWNHASDRLWEHLDAEGQNQSRAGGAGVSPTTQ